MERKVYDTKFFGGINFNDYWDLRNHPLYISFDKKNKPYLKFKENPDLEYIKVESLTDIANIFKKNDWVFQTKYWKFISHTLMASLNIPYTKL